MGLCETRVMCSGLGGVVSDLSGTGWTPWSVAPDCDLAESVYLWYTRVKTMPDGPPDLATGWVGEK